VISLEKSEVHHAMDDKKTPDLWIHAVTTLPFSAQV